MQSKSWLKSTVLTAMAAVGVIAATAPSASAYIACNRYGECWHVHQRWAYPRGAGIVFHADNWRFARRGWRWAGDRDDRGYWNHGAWRRF